MPSSVTARPRRSSHSWRFTPTICTGWPFTQQLVVAHFDASGSRRAAVTISTRLAGRVAQRRDDAVQHRRLVRPRRDPAQRELRARDVTGEHVAVDQLDHRRAAPEDRHRDVRRRRRATCRARRRARSRRASPRSGAAEKPTRSSASSVAAPASPSDGRSARSAIQVGAVQVSDDAAVQTRQPPLILIFEPASRRTTAPPRARSCSRRRPDAA